MFSKSGHIASTRKAKHYFHKRRALFWTMLFVLADALFALLLVGFGLGSFAVFFVLLEALFSETQRRPVTTILRMFVSVLILFPFMLSFAWWMLASVREIRSNHLRLAAGYAQKSAEEILATRSSNESFGLFLRGFDFEAQSTTYSGPNIEVGSKEAQVYGRPIEALLVEMLDSNVPLIALADPRNLEPLPGVSRFESVPTNWVEFIHELLPNALPVIVYLTALTPGIKLEINILESLGYSKKSIVIISRNLAVKNSPGGEQLLSILSAFDHIIFEQTDKAWSRTQEVAFHSSLQKCLQLLEHDCEGMQFIRKPAATFRSYTPTWPYKLFHFLTGPAFNASVLIAALIIFEMILGVLVPGSDAHSPRRIMSLVAIWPELFIAIAVMKGITYVLFAHGPGDHKHFPGFSRIVKQIKNHSRTSR